MLLALAPATAWAEAHLLVSAVGDVKVLLDGEDVGWLAGEGHAPVLVQEPGRHGVQVETYSGELLAERNIDLDDGETMAVRWDGEQLTIRPIRELQLERAAESRAEQAQSQRQPTTMQVAQAGTAIAGIVAPSNPVVAGVSTGLTIAGAGSTLGHSAQGALDAATRQPRTAPATTASEDHGLEHLEQSGFDPYEATGGRPSIDASLASVTFVAPAGTDALVTIDGQPVATIGAERTEATVAVVPGMHKVMIFDATGAQLLHRGYLTVTAGWVVELRFSATEPPVSSLPDAWR